MKALLHLAKCCFRRERQDQYLRPTNDQPTTNGDQALAAAHHISQSAVLYINTFTNTSKNHTPDSYKNIKLAMIWRISWTDDESHLPTDVSRISSLDEYAIFYKCLPQLLKANYFY